MFRHASFSHEFLSRVASSAHSQNLFAIRWGSTLMRCCYSQTLHGLGWSFAVYIVLCSCAQLIDTFPTLCDLMGLPQPTTDAFALEGVSLRPLLERPSLGRCCHRVTSHSLPTRAVHKLVRWCPHQQGQGQLGTLSASTTRSAPPLNIWATLFVPTPTILH